MTRCMTCGMDDPPPEQTCVYGADHAVGHRDGCRYCARLEAVCQRSPCPPMRHGRAWRIWYRVRCRAAGAS